MFKTIRLEDRVTIRTPLGQERSGRAVMFNKQVGAWVLNMGGKHGVPGLADERNTLAVAASKRDGFQRTASIINGRN